MVSVSWMPTPNMERFTQKFDGEFAIVVTDFKRRIIVLSTDVFSTKPLWYAIDSQKGFGVASYESALLRLGLQNRRQLDWNTILVIDMDTHKILRTHSVHKFDLENQNKTTFEDYDKALIKAIRKRALVDNETMSLWPVFIGLSSGYDSGAIAAALQEEEIPFRAYSILGLETGHLIKKRLSLIRRSPKSTGDFLHMTQLQYTSAEYVMNKRVEYYRYKMTLKGGAGSTVTTDKASVGLTYICQLARQRKYLVYLSGTGADEIVCDYGFGGKKIHSYSSTGGLFPANLTSVWPWRSITDILPSYIAKEEYVLGSHGIEGRYPFLDTEVVQEFLWLNHTLKNLKYKAPIQDFLSRREYPFYKCDNFTFDCKKGFAPDQNTRKTPTEISTKPPTVAPRILTDPPKISIAHNPVPNKHRQQTLVELVFSVCFLVLLFIFYKVVRGRLDNPNVVHDVNGRKYVAKSRAPDTGIEHGKLI